MNTEIVETEEKKKQCSDEEGTADARETRRQVESQAQTWCFSSWRRLSPLTADAQSQDSEL
jgi:hypothetical protein